MRFPQFRYRNTAQASLGKFDRLPRTPAGSTVLAFDGCGLRDQSPARPARNASYPVSVRQVAVLLHASFRHRLAVMPLRFAKPSPPSGWPGDFHPQAIEHARHATKPLRGSGAHSATRPYDRKWAPRMSRPPQWQSWIVRQLHPTMSPDQHADVTTPTSRKGDSRRSRIDLLNPKSRQICNVVCNSLKFLLFSSVQSPILKIRAMLALVVSAKPHLALASGVRVIGVATLGDGHD